MTLLLECWSAPSERTSKEEPSRPRQLHLRHGRVPPAPLAAATHSALLATGAAAVRVTAKFLLRNQRSSLLSCISHAG